MDKPGKGKRITIRCTDALYAAIHAKAGQRKTSRTTLITQAIYEAHPEFAASAPSAPYTDTDSVKE
jgi:hypothetical protein